jgi:hypothetical protein
MIGKVEVDQGDTGCETSDAAEYITRTLKRKQQLSSKTASVSR